MVMYTISKGQEEGGGGELGLEKWFTWYDCGNIENIGWPLNVLLWWTTMCGSIKTAHAYEFKVIMWYYFLSKT